MRETFRVDLLGPDLVILLFRLDNIETKLFVELDGRLVVNLDMQKDGGEIAVILHNIEDMLQHLCADSKTPVGGQTAECHDI